MIPRTPTLPFIEPAMWRKLLDRVHADAGGVYKFVLRLLFSCRRSEAEAGSLHKQRVGATSKQLAAIGHAVGMTKEEHVKGYRMAKAVSLRRRHANHIFQKLLREAA